MSAGTTNTNFSIVLTSDPQWPWYDYVHPTGLTTEKQIEKNSEDQITAQYESVNELATELQSTFPVAAVMINGDLTSFGHAPQLEKYKTLVDILNPKIYPALGNHDYANNVDDCANNDCATRMVLYMYDWLQENTRNLTSLDIAARSYYRFPELRTDYSGSLAYSFDIGPVHVVMLQNFPSYADTWDSWDGGGAQRRFFYIRESMYWLANDLAVARNRGAIILVFVHDYDDNFLPPQWEEFRKLMIEYDVSAVFAGHIHEDCGQIDTIPKVGSWAIPVFRSGSASYQDYLLAELTLGGGSPAMTVTKYSQPDGGAYGPGDTWPVTLIDRTPSSPLPVPPREGWVTFFNEGGFVAQFELRYTDKTGAQVTESTGYLRLGEKRTYFMPPDATNVQVKGEEDTGLVWEGFRTVFNLTPMTPPNVAYRLYGTTLDPQWEKQAFQP